MSIKSNAASALMPNRVIALQKTSKTKRSPIVKKRAIALQKTSKTKGRRVAACH
ncbi:hypothetical protein LC609_16660 [Nostoc sp. XA013]|nr:hypothetical protein [Nostoc sp. XA013]